MKIEELLPEIFKLFMQLKVGVRVQTWLAPKKLASVLDRLGSGNVKKNLHELGQEGLTDISNERSPENLTDIFKGLFSGNLTDALIDKQQGLEKKANFQDCLNVLRDGDNAKIIKDYFRANIKGWLQEEEDVETSSRSQASLLGKQGLMSKSSNGNSSSRVRVVSRGSSSNKEGRAKENVTPPPQQSSSRSAGALTINN